MALLGFALLLAAWVGGNPPGASPDEPASVVKALGAAQGEWTGRAAPGTTLPPGHTPLQTQFFRDYSQTFAVPAGVRGVPQPACYAMHPQQSAACETTDRPTAGRLPAGFIGPYAPFVYVPMGLPALPLHSSAAITVAIRAATAAMCLALLSGAVLVGRSRLHLAGVVLATTPMVVFLSSSVSTSGLEVLSATCLLSSVLALRRGPAAGPGTWAWLGASGVVLAVARPLGPVEVVLAAVLALVLVGPRGAARRVRSGGAAATTACVAVAVATGVAVLWSALVLPPASAPLSDAARFAGDALDSVPARLPQLVGVFGWLDTPLPLPALVVVAVLAGAVVAAGIALGRAADRVALVLGLVAVPVLLFALQADTQLPFGFGVQGRYALPVAVALPLLAAHVLQERGGSVSRSAAALAPVVTVLMAAVQLVAWWYNARRYAYGTDGPLWWLGTPVEWAPAGGWRPWAALAVAGALLLAVSGLGRTATTASGTAASSTHPH